MINIGDMVYVFDTDKHFEKSKYLKGKIGRAVDIEQLEGQAMIGVDFCTEVRDEYETRVTHGNFSETKTGYWLCENVLKVIGGQGYANI